MSSEWEVSTALVLAQLQGTLARADLGASPSRLALYTTARPATIAQAHADTPQAEIVLAKPCGAIVQGQLVLYVADTSGAMVATSGIPRWAEWIAGDGAVLTRCDVTDLDNGGGIRVRGGTTPPGETSPMLYAGGKVQLGLIALY